LLRGSGLGSNLGKGVYIVFWGEGSLGVWKHGLGCIESVLLIDLYGVRIM
jgi:hypothetical protein